MDLITGIVFGEDYYGDEVNELAVASHIKGSGSDRSGRYQKFH